MLYEDQIVLGKPSIPASFYPCIFRGQLDFKKAKKMFGDETNTFCNTSNSSSNNNNIVSKSSACSSSFNTGFGSGSGNNHISGYGNGDNSRNSGDSKSMNCSSFNTTYIVDSNGEKISDSIKEYKINH